MALKQELGTLLNKKMDRKDFLKVIGVGVVAATGLGAILRTVAPAPSASQSKVSSASKPVGYGSSVYGGTKNS